MRVLIDTNVLLDALMGRQPYFDIADKIIRLCADGKIDGRMAAHSVPNMFYILRKDMSDGARRSALKNLCQIVEIVSIDSFMVLSSIDNTDFADFEDCLQVECAIAISADYIVTRNVKDFDKSTIPVITPADFLKMV